MHELICKESLDKMDMNTKRVCVSESDQSPALLIYHQATGRRSANYQPSIWSLDSFECLRIDSQMQTSNERATKLEEDVIMCLINKEEEGEDKLGVLELIDDIERLGLRCRFRDCIHRSLHKIASTKEIRGKTTLHATALNFRLLRDHGFQVSQDVFRSFVDDEGNFMTCPSDSTDMEGLLSLYEASCHGFEGEELLEVAREFSSKQLNKWIVENSGTNTFVEQVMNHAMELPLVRRMERVEARWYIDAYAKRDNANILLLELAKLDFNLVQSMLTMELQHVSRWWRSLGLVEELSFARDRVVECFFSAVGIVADPNCLNETRISLTKVMALLSTLDDIYDLYGSLDELQSFTNAVQRWDICAMENLPQYLKVFFLALYNTVNEMAYYSMKRHGVNITSHLRKVWADLCGAFLLEAQWDFGKKIPSLEEYMSNGWVSSSGCVILVHAYFLVTQNVTQEALDCLESYHQLLRLPAFLFRLQNDLATSKAEIERGEDVNSIQCYIQETGNSEEQARDYVTCLIEETWEKMNRERTATNSPFPKSFIELVANFGRTVQCVYQFGDGHGTPDKRIKSTIASVILDRLTI